MLLFAATVHFFLFMRSIPLYRHTNLVIPSSADGYLGCFQFGVTTNKAAITKSFFKN